jgi:hypothetical protein
MVNIPRRSQCGPCEARKYDPGWCLWQSGGDVVLVGESAENLPAVDPVLGEVDRLRWLSLGLSWCELAEGAVRPGSVIVLQVFGQRRRRWCSLTISTWSKSSRRRVQMILSQSALPPIVNYT